MKFVNYANKVITKHCHFAKMIDTDVPLTFTKSSSGFNSVRSKYVNSETFVAPPRDGFLNKMSKGYKQAFKSYINSK